MATSTTQSAWRSFGGDTTKTAYAGDMLMVAEFYIPFSQVTANTAVQISSTNTNPVILPAGAEVAFFDLKSTITGGTTPQLNLGLRVNSTGVNTATALSATLAAGTTQQANIGTAGVGANVGSALSTTSLMTLTGAFTGTPAAGAIVGHLYYYVPNGGAATA